MMVSWSKRAASARWDRNHYDNMTLRVPKGQREKIKEHATTNSESMNGFVRRAIRELMEREGNTSVDV